MTSPESAPLKLASIPRLGELLRRDGILSEDSHEKLDSALRDPAHAGKFVGNLAVELHLPNEKTGQVFNDEDLSAALKAQALQKTAVAREDLQTIQHGGPQAAPEWLKANWGNNGVNLAPEKIKIEDGMSAAANIAQNLVMTANLHPELAETFAPAVDAAIHIATGLNKGFKPLDRARNIETWLGQMSDALSKVPAPLSSNHSEQPIEMHDYINARGKEIRGALRRIGYSPPSLSAGDLDLG